MRKSKSTDSQIMAALKRAEVGDLCRELTISTATFRKWRAKCSGMDSSALHINNNKGARPSCKVRLGCTA